MLLKYDKLIKSYLHCYLIVNADRKLFFFSAWLDKLLVWDVDSGLVRLGFGVLCMKCQNECHTSRLRDRLTVDALMHGSRQCQRQERSWGIETENATQTEP